MHIILHTPKRKRCPLEDQPVWWIIILTAANSRRQIERTVDGFGMFASRIRVPQKSCKCNIKPIHML